MTPIQNFLIVVVALFMIVSCKNDNEQDITPQTAIADTVPAVVSLNTHVNKIFNKYSCTNTSCHGGNARSGEVNLSNYDKLKIVATSGQLYGAISHAPNYIAMPQGGGKLNDVELATIKKWIDAGALNN